MASVGTRNYAAACFRKRRGNTLSPDTITGDGILTAEGVGAEPASGPGTGGLWMPVSAMPAPDGQIRLFPHIILDRAKPGLLAVNHTGRRFTNEADSYHAFVEAMLANVCTPDRPAHLLCDRSFIRDYGIGFIHPGTRRIGGAVIAAKRQSAWDARRLTITSRGTGSRTVRASYVTVAPL